MATRGTEGRPVEGMGRERQVRTIFSEIAPRYDLLNRVLSLSVDRRWRRRAIDALGWEAAPAGTYLDACAGTYDLARELCDRRSFRGSVVASDFALPMLQEGRGKVQGRAVRPVCGDTLRLPFPDAVFSGATVAFGVRNLAHLERGLAELQRVLAPGGRLVILEFTEPPNPLFRALYHFYFRSILPRVGRLVSGHPWAYTYLPESVKEFPDPDGLAELLRGVGFDEVRWRFLTWGIAALHLGVKPGARGGG